MRVNGTEEYDNFYLYDALENIEAHTVNGNTITYVYDELNRLTRENNPILNKTFVYTYDFGGNITSKKTYAYTTGALGTPEKTDSYTYANSAWKDQLTAYNGVVFSYDASGNPLGYYNGDVYHFTWEQGRRLATATKGVNTLSFTYNSDGIRTSKTVNGITHNYVLNGTSVYSDTWIENNIQHIVVYIYDDTGLPIGMAYRNSTMVDQAYEYYFFAKNAQGDIVAIYNPAGAKLIEYKYDAWGNTTIAYHNGGASTSARYNSLTYRGYFYDSETGLYYLVSRYYDPAVGRFINADTYVSTGQGIGGYNMFSYCRNNPASRKDSLGSYDEDLKDDDADTPIDDFGPQGQGKSGANSGKSSSYRGSSYSHAHSSRSYSSRSSSTSSRSSGSNSSRSAGKASANGAGRTIYRWNCTNTNNLKPSNSDVKNNSPLSFSTQYKPGSAQTTIESVNSTGVLHAELDGKTHVSVYPLGGTIAEWRLAGKASIWTTALASVVEFLD